MATQPAAINAMYGTPEANVENHTETNGYIIETRNSSLWNDVAG